jgi:cytochrome c oxidase subunit 4
VSTHGHTAAEQAAEHASVGTYVRVALILTVVTALEVGVIYIRFLTPIVVPLLLVMASAKFILVVMFFMHLRYDARPLTAVFVGPLIMATVLGLSLIALVGTLLAYHR